MVTMVYFFMPKKIIQKRKKTKKKKIPKTGMGGWPVEYLNAQANLNDDYGDEKKFKDPSEWDNYYGEKNNYYGEKKKRELAERRIINEYFDGRSASNNSDLEKKKNKSFDPFFFIPDNAFGGFLILLFLTWLIFGVIFDIGTDLGPPGFFGHDGG